MKNEYYPLSHLTCYHFYNNKGCNFCGFHSQKRTVSETKVNEASMIKHFNAFVNENYENIKKADKLIIAPNGSWFTEVPIVLRNHIYNFIEQNDVSTLKYESRATLFNLGKAFGEFVSMYKAKGYTPALADSFAQKDVWKLTDALKEVKPNHIVSFGLEVANNNDLRTLNKGCVLEDYVIASNKVHKEGAKVCANILIAPPKINDPIYKAFQTAEFGVQRMGASEFLVMPCSPMKGTKTYDAWINAEWNPVSATAASEVFRIIREQFPEVLVRYLDLRIYTKHGRHGKFKRKPGKWSDEEKLEVREEIREIAKKVF